MLKIRWIGVFSRGSAVQSLSSLCVDCTGRLVIHNSLKTWINGSMRGKKNPGYDLILVTGVTIEFASQGIA